MSRVASVYVSERIIESATENSPLSNEPPVKNVEILGSTTLTPFPIKLWIWFYSIFEFALGFRSEPHACKNRENTSGTRTEIILPTDEQT